MAILLVCALSAVPVNEMLGRMLVREAALDRLVIDYRFTANRVPSSTPWDQCFDPDVVHSAALLPDLTAQVFNNRATLVRPTVMVESLTDDAARGYAPVTLSTAGGQYTSVHARPSADGKRLWMKRPDSPVAGDLRFVPLLQALDLGLHDTTTPGLSLRKLFSDYPIEVVSAAGAVTTYRVTVSESQLRHTFELDMDADAVPLRIRNTISSIANPAAFQPIVQEMRPFEFVVVSGQRLPRYSIMTTANPNVGPDYGVATIAIDGVQQAPTLTAADVTLTPDTKNAIVITMLPDNMHQRVTYDADGNLQDAGSGGAPGPLSGGAVTQAPPVSPPVARAPIALLAGGAALAAGLLLIPRLRAA